MANREAWVFLWIFTLKDATLFKVIWKSRRKVLSSIIKLHVKSNVNPKPYVKLLKIRLLLSRKLATSFIFTRHSFIDNNKDENIHIKLNQPDISLTVLIFGHSWSRPLFHSDIPLDIWKVIYSFFLKDICDPMRSYLKLYGKWK